MTRESEFATFRCSLAARSRADELLATAPPARRFFLLEVPGPWASPDVLAASGLRADVAESVRHRVGAAAARMLLIRRPGRHPAPDPGTPRRWAVAVLGRPDAGAPAGGVAWGTWTEDEDLLAIDPASVVPRAATRPLALVCTHGRHDVCCAIEGRPVAAVAATDPGVDVWECSHLGGDRFAANLLWLPSGLLFGGLTAETVGGTLAAALDGRVRLDHFRGRCGDPHAAQAAQWHAMRALGEERPDAVVVESVHAVHENLHGDAVEDPDEPHQVATVRHGPGDAARRFRVELAARWSAPHRLTCHAPAEGRARAYRLVAFAATDG